MFNLKRYTPSKLRKYLFTKINKQQIKRQELMLLIAIAECGFDPRRQNIRVNHDRGISYINGHRLNLIYPKYYFDLASQFHTMKKQRDYYFSGHPGSANERKYLLEPFSSLNSLIEYTKIGREARHKSSFNFSYYREMSNSKFVLCPHQPNWSGNWEHLWTYRYVEACIAKSVPLVFKETPLSSAFTDGSFFIENHRDHSIENYQHVVEKNYQWAKHKFTIQPEDEFCFR